MPDDLPQLGADGRILEGIVTTYNQDGSVNVSPMGPIVDTSVTRFVFRPFRTSTTYKNLKRERRGVFHITDDVLLFAQAALGQPEPFPELDGLILQNACRWHAFDIEALDDADERTHIVARTTESGRLRDFLGFNRAMHAVLEAAILATRIHLLPAEEIRQQVAALESPVRKTASDVELQAFALLCDYIHRNLTTDDGGRSQP